VPYLTPDSIPEETDCRSLLIPASTDWLAIVSGALTELTKTWNWQQFGSVTVDEAVDAMQAMIDQYYLGCSGGCELPEGGEIIRIGEDGRIEVLSDGAWIAPTGDYLIPPPEAREGGTAGDQICLAATNAVNVLHELYDQLSDYFNDELSDAAALLGLAAFMTTATAFEFAPIVAGIAAFLLPIFAGVYSALSYLTADLWDENLDEQLICFLQECASNDGGVVTFDWDCFTGKLNSLTDEFGLSEVQLRFYLQISYLLLFIGGVDGLNLAGGTTEITEAECSCTSLWCRISDWTTDEDGYSAGYPGFENPYTSVWVSGQGWKQSGVYNSTSNGFHQYVDPITIKSFRLDWNGSGVGCPGCGASLQLWLSGSLVYTGSISSTFATGFIFNEGLDVLCDLIVIGGDAGGGGAFAFTRLEVVYEAADAELGEDNCP